MSKYFTLHKLLYINLPALEIQLKKNLEASLSHLKNLPALEIQLKKNLSEFQWLSGTPRTLASLTQQPSPSSPQWQVSSSSREEECENFPPVYYELLVSITWESEETTAITGCRMLSGPRHAGSHQHFLGHVFTRLETGMCSIAVIQRIAWCREVSSSLMG